MNCSNKIIGARYYDKDMNSSELKEAYLSPRDENGHGTHCASTAAGKGFLFRLYIDVLLVLCILLFQLFLTFGCILINIRCQLWYFI